MRVRLLMRRRITIGVALVLLLLVLAPWATGIWFEQSYRRMISSYNLQGDVHVQIVEYHRSWLRSEALILIKIKSPEIRELLQAFGASGSIYELILEQKIQHGPFIYNKAKLPSFIGLVAIKNTLHISPDIQAIFMPQKKKLSILTNEDLVSFAGNYFKHFEIEQVQVSNASNNIIMQIGQGILGNIWLLSKPNRILGDVALNNFVLKDQENKISMSNLEINFDQQQAPSNLWVGKMSLKFPEMTWIKSNDQKVSISDFDFQGVLSESSGKLYAQRNLNIKSVQIDDETVGPIHLKISASRLSSKAILDIISAYLRIVREGELYESQLQYKMSGMFPQVFLRNAKVKVEDLNIATERGELKLIGELTWPYNESGVSNVSTLWNDAYGQGNLKISKLLVNHILDYALETPIIYGMLTNKQKELLAIQQNLQLASQRNYFFIYMLVTNHFLTNDNALDLLDLQRDDAPIQEYAAQLKKLFLDTQITREQSYMLFWQYSAVTWQMRALDDAIELDKKNIKDKFNQQVNTWLKQGLITQDQNNYTVLIQKEGETIKLNGKEI